MENGLSKDLRLLAFRSISGEVTPNMRMIAFAYHENTVEFVFYLQDPETDIDRECAEIIALNFDSGFWGNLKSLDIKFVTTREPLGLLDAKDLQVFRRWEDPDVI